MKEALFKCKIEELPFLGTLILDNFTRDKIDFAAFSPDYKDPFVTTCLTQTKTTGELAAPKKLMGEQKLTKGLHLYRSPQRCPHETESTGKRK